ncbi:MAG: hypothetical protein Q8O84_02890 [Nanoarchaeota archaeon]|nr:hypothetical protein [Nanoarchaeota archaeon]
MKNLKNYLVAGMIGLGSFNSYSQDTLKTADGYEVFFDDWQILKYNKKNQLIIKFLKSDGDIKHTHFYGYDDKGQKIKDEWFISYKNEKSEKEMTSLYFYNSKGDVTREIRIYKKGQKEVMDHYVK